MTSYHTAGVQQRAIMHGATVIGFADGPAIAELIAAALRAWDTTVGTGTSAAPAPAPRYRVGRSLGRTVYRIVGAEPSNDDELIGLMDTPEFGALVVAALNHM
jgi:hypothetical protein